MKFLDALFGTGSSYSRVRKQLPSDQLKRLVNTSQLTSLSTADERCIEEAILNARVNGAVSLYMVDRVLQSLVSQHTISIHDKAGVLDAIARYFDSNI